ncbi:histone-lysine N-methyltransferase SETMAR [Trichonephila clavipes]|nr:histone-lysine N-methyltransferase SETMAR [Trichonephila clavipes]
MNEQQINLKLCFKLSRTSKEIYAMLVSQCSRPHTANIVKQFREKKGLLQIGHPPYSPDLNPPDFFIFPRIKLALKRNRFDDIPDIHRNATWPLNSIPNEDFLQSFQDMYSRSQRCIVMGGDYFEGHYGVLSNTGSVLGFTTTLVTWLNKEKRNLLICRGAIYQQQEQSKSSDPLDAATKVVRST